jgi:hypothetical protein
MSNLIPQKRPDRNGVMVTRHVKAVTASTGKQLPPPSSLSAMRKKDLNNDDVIKGALYLQMGEWEADDYFAFIMRKPRVVQVALAKALTDVVDRDQINAALAILEECSDQTLIVLALDDLGFITDMARPPHGSEALHPGTTTAYQSVLTVMTQVFTDNFSRGTLDPETADRDTYGPFLRAATITKVLGLDSSAPTSLDRHRQIEHVSGNVNTFARHYPELIRITQATNRSPLPMDSHIMLKVCEVLDERPEAAEVLVAYTNERQRFDMDEFAEMLDGPSLSLSSGTL